MQCMKPKTFDPEKTLAVIADIFAENGYEGTTLEDIVRVTGLGKQSLYNAYGDKKSMVTKSLQCYGRNSAKIQTLCDPALNGRERLERFFEAVLLECADYQNPGCLITNLLLEKGGTDHQVRKIASARWNENRKAFLVVIKAGLKDGSIHTKLDPETLSFMLMNLLSGLRVTVRASKDMAKIKQVVQTSLHSML